MNIAIIDEFKTIRAYTETLCRPLKREDYVVQVAEFASPTKWHLAHTTWFFETFILIEFLEGYKVFHPNFNFLFNSYYNNVGDRVFRAHRGHITRPDVNEVYAYRKYVDKHIAQLLSQTNSSEIEALVNLGIQHEQQHQELLITDIKYTLSTNPIFPTYERDKVLVNSTNTKNNFIKIDQGVYIIGHRGADFCYDNELGVHKVFLNAFEISQALVTNQDFIDFINDGGYNNFNLWLDAGWSWVNTHNIKAPLYWHYVNETWHYFTLGGLKEVKPKAQVSHISFYEAYAIAQWKSMRLPTEFEWEIASQHLNWGTRWEWTYSGYLPYPNFKTNPTAIGEYNGKFMINQMVLRGASVATSPNHSRYTYRNFFHPHERWQFTGIRLVK